MIYWNWHLIVSLPSSQKTISFQLTNYLIWFTQFTIFSTKLKKHKYQIKSKRLRLQIMTFLMFLVLFSKKSRFNWRRHPSEKIIIVEEELDRIDRDGIGKLTGLLIYDECWNPKVAVHGGELARNINQKKKPDILQACRCSLCDKRYRREDFFNMHLEYCESVRFV